MRLGLVALVVTIFGGAYLIAGRAPEDRVIAKPQPKREAAIEREPQVRGAVKGVRHKQAKPAPAPAPALPRFVGEHFSIQYPKGWKVESAEVSKGAYLDTTIRHPQSPSTYLRIDVTPGGGAAPAAHAKEVEGYLRRQDTYRRIGLAPAQLSGFPAMRWDFDVVESGVRLRKVDVFLAHDGRNIAVLTQAPSGEFERYAALFARLRASLVPHQ
jgi:hypothetical protein